MISSGVLSSVTSRVAPSGYTIDVHSQPGNEYPAVVISNSERFFGAYIADFHHDFIVENPGVMQVLRKTFDSAIGEDNR